MLSLAVIFIVVLVAIFAPVFAAITGHGVYQQFRTTGLSPEGQPVGPGGSFLMGTDDQGRDIMVRIAYGARISLFVGVVATALTVVDRRHRRPGRGLLRQDRRHRPRPAHRRAARLPVPAARHRPGLDHRARARRSSSSSSAFFGWASVARIVRGQVLSIREKEYIEAARALGAGPWRIMFIDILPNVIAPIIVYTTLLIPLTIVAEASLSFLGVGVPPPTADWGQMISESANYYNNGAWWFLVFPSLALLITTLAFNIFGDGVRDAFDPRGDQLFV